MKKSERLLQTVLIVLSLLFCWQMSAQCGPGEDSLAPVFDQAPFSLDIEAECAEEFTLIAPTATDNCDTDPTVFVVNDFTVPGPCDNIYVRNVTYRGEDASGNFALYNVSITVMDFIAPLFDQAPGELDQMVSCTGIAPAVVEPTATDNCAGVIVAQIGNDIVPLPGGCEGTYIQELTYRATDACGNASDYTVQITVNDEEPPVFTAEPGLLDQYLSCGAELDEIPVPEVSDNCGAVELVVASDETVAGDCAFSYVRTIIYQATDACANSATFPITITANDLEAPYFTSEPGSLNQTLSCTEETGGDPTALVPEVADNCGEASAILISDQTEVTGCNGSIRTLIWRAQDACGNVGETFEVIAEVVDEAAPQWVGASNAQVIELSCFEVDQFELTAPTATDLCGTPMVTLTDTQTETGTCGSNYSTVYSYQVEDDCGNANNEFYTITVLVNDNEAPIITDLPGALDLFLSCSEYENTELPTPSFTSQCGIAELQIQSDEITNESCPGAFKRIISYIAVDDCGNASDVYVLSVDVSDSEAPVFTSLPENALLECGESPSFEEPTATDNCGAVEIDYIDQSFPGACNYSYTIHRVWTATDACGNIAQHTQIFENEDMVAPVWLQAEGQLDESICSGNLEDVLGPAAIDDCAAGKDLQINYVDETISAGADGAAFCDGHYVINRLWQVSDLCGNSSSYLQVITVYTTPLASVASGEGCEIHLNNLCDNYEVLWTDNLGNSGTGGSYTPTGGTEGAIDFNIVNTDSPDCPFTVIKTPFNCEETCPDNITIGSNVGDAVCSGTFFNLSAQIQGDSDGTITWYDGDDNLLPGSTGISVLNNGCVPFNHSFYAVFVPADASCPTLTSDLLNLLIYPNITVEVNQNDDCHVAVTPSCSNYLVNWIDSEGGAGEGNVYLGSPGGSGSVTFVVTNPGADIPVDCSTANFSFDYSCEQTACPELYNAVCNPPVVCEDEPFSLHVNVLNFDGGTLQWFDQDDNLLGSTAGLFLDVQECAPTTAGYYVVYTPADPSCSAVTSEMAMVSVYPNIEGEAINSGCVVQLNDHCENYDIQWTDSNGNSGSGSTYTANSGSGTVDFIISNPAAPFSCQSLELSSSYQCVDCPELFNVSCNPSVLCEGQPFNLHQDLLNEDGGTLQWFDQNGNPVSTTEGLTVDIDDCMGGFYGFYAQYTPATPGCPVSVSPMAFVSVYPSIEATVLNNDCTVALEGLCSDFQVSWTDSDGNTGQGVYYEAGPGSNGNVIFTVLNDGFGVPAVCSEATYTANFACGGCPELSNAVCSPNVICDTEPFSLHVNVENQDGGVLQWYNEAGEPVFNINELTINLDACEGGMFGYYAEYTPAVAGCPVVTTATTFVTVYPSIHADLVVSDCTVELENDCGNFTTTWESSTGDSGSGSTFNAPEGSSGTVTFTVMNPDGLEGLSCYQQDYSADYDCAGCPSLSNAAVSPNVVCEGQALQLSVGVNDPDGGTTQWFDEAGNEVTSTPNAPAVGCDGGQAGFYSVYTPISGSCQSVTSDLTYVTIYPTIEAEVSGDACELTLEGFCPDYLVSWTSSDGQGGSGVDFSAATGGSGTVTYTVINPNAPIACQEGTFLGGFNCAACPSIASVSVLPPSICSGASFELEANINDGDGGTIQWFDLEGNLMPNNEALSLTNETCAPLNYGFYAVYTPVDGSCANASSSVANLTVYPAVGGIVEAAGCEVDVAPLCDAYSTSWTDSNGNNGFGTHFEGSGNSEGQVTFTITSSFDGIPAACSSTNITAPFGCEACPDLFNVGAIPAVLCQSDTYDLNLDVFNDDGGSIQWFEADGTPVANTENISQDVPNCTGLTLSYYAVYTPASASCEEITTEMIEVQIFAEIPGELQINDCSISVIDVCDGFEVVWYDSFGQTDSGDSYEAIGSGEVTFTIYNSNLNTPSDCNNATLSYDFNCDAPECPVSLSAFAFPPVICSGEEYDLNATVVGDDGGTVQWFDQSDNVVSNTDDVTGLSFNCEGSQFGYYAVYTPNDPSCEQLTSDLTYVFVYPDVSADVQISDCTVELEDYCPNYQVSWMDGTGNTGTSDTYVSSDGGSGTVTFTVTNPAVAGSDCHQESFTATFNCNACPSFGDATVSAATVCNGDPVTLNVELQEGDGGSLSWFSNAGFAVADPTNVNLTNTGCNVEVFGFYAIYLPAGDCNPITSATVSVAVYPDIVADFDVSSCQVDLDPACSNWLVTWVDSDGNSGNGDTYNAEENTSGTVSFTVNSGLPNVPNGCAEDTFTSSYACGTVEPCENVIEEYCVGELETIIICPDFCGLDGAYTIEDIVADEDCSPQITSATCISFFAHPGASGIEVLEVIACLDGECDEVTIHVNISETCNGSAPSAEDDTIDLPCGESSEITVLSNDSDADNDALEICDYSQALNGSVDLVGDELVYTPTEAFHGNDIFSYTVCDGTGNSSTANVFVTVIPAEACGCDVTEAPVVVTSGDVGQTVLGEDLGIVILANDSYPGDCNPTVSITSAPSHGMVSINPDGTLTYMPAVGFAGAIDFAYELCCGDDCSTSTVSLQVLDDLTCNLKLPTGFSPNNDGENEKFTIPELDDCYTNATKGITIFNRFGEIVHEDESYRNDNAWEGTFKNSSTLVPEGTYFFVLRIHAEDYVREETGSIRVQY